MYIFNIQFEAQKLKDTFDRQPGRWWIRKVSFADCCRDWTCHHKVNGGVWLTGHQSLKIPTLHTKCILKSLLISSRYLRLHHRERPARWMRCDRYCDMMPKRDGRKVPEAFPRLVRKSTAVITSFTNSRKVHLSRRGSDMHTGLLLSCLSRILFLHRSLVFLSRGGLPLFLK